MTKSQNVALERRMSHDVECEIEGEIIQLPCIDVRRFRIRHGMATERTQGRKSQKGEDPDKAQGTIEQIALIEPITWNKSWRRAYGHDFPGDPQAVSCEANLQKSGCFYNIVWKLGTQIWSKSFG